MSKKLTTEEFIKRAKEVHGDKYDYSLVEYVNTDTKVKIICPKHGVFEQRPYSHLIGNGCKKCVSPNYGITTDDFIKKAQKVHNNKYDYSKVKYINITTKVCIICPEHGEFWQSPYEHLQGKGCAKCCGKNKTFDDFIKMAKKVHGNKYDYSKVKYVNMTTKVCIICPEHGEFWQTPHDHLNSKGCRKCATIVNANKTRLTISDFITRAKQVHGDKYDYSKVVYKGNSVPVIVICPEHGEFKAIPSFHWKGVGCPKCANKNVTTEEFIAKAKKVHGDKYDYSKVNYVNNKTKVCIICPEHGEFWQTPHDHLSNQGCPNCSGLRKQYKFNLLEEFESEYAFRAFLENNDVNILQIILGSLCELEPKYAAIENDIRKVLTNKSHINPIQALKEKYSTETDDNYDVEQTQESTTINLDNDDEVYNMLNIARKDKDNGQQNVSIEDVIKNDEQELQVINKIEHMLTPEIRNKIMNKYLNDKRRAWMAARKTNK